MLKTKRGFFLIILLILSSFLRLYRLGQMPYGITNDEAGYIYNAYSISRTLKDVNGVFLPLSINLDNPFSPVPIYINALFLRILGLSVFSGRFVYALLGILSVFLLFLIARFMFKNERIALATSFVFAISPWHLHVSRSAYEAGVALFFFLLAFLVFLKNTKKGNICWSLPFFLLAFWSYHATKIFFIFFIPILILANRGLFKRKKELLCFSLGVGLIIFSFAYLGISQKAFGRASTFLFNDLGKAATFVDWERKASSAPFIFRQVFSNKPLYFLRVIRENYLNAFSPQYLFLYGETSGLGAIYGTFFRGIMYIIELPLLILGVIKLLKEYAKVKEIILLSLFIAPLPTAFTFDASYVMRAIMMVPFLSLLVGLGIMSVISSIGRLPSIIKKLATFSFFALYFFLLTSYLYQYHFRYSIYGAESWFRSSRELSTFIKESQKNYSEVIIVEPSSMFILQYGFFAKIDPREIQEIWGKPMPKKLGNITFLRGCYENQNSPTSFLAAKTLYIVPEGCHKKYIPFATIKDFGEPLRVIWKIYST